MVKREILLYGYLWFRFHTVVVELNVLAAAFRRLGPPFC